MKATVNGNLVLVSLSRKNLLDLVAQVFGDRDNVALTRFIESGHQVYVCVEDNETHYEGRKPGPGSGLVS